MSTTPQKYQQMADAAVPPTAKLRTLLGAFLIGGLICTLGQLLLAGFKALGLEKDLAATAASASLIFLSALLTALSVYDDIAKHAGAGTLVPITGFANAVVSPAMEFRTEVRCIIGIVRENRNR